MDQEGGWHLCNNSLLFSGSETSSCQPVAFNQVGYDAALGKRKEGTLKVFAYTLFQRFLWSDGEESPPRAGESWVLWSGRVMGCPSPPFLPLPLVLPRKAAWQSELIVTHSGRSSLALPHMVTRCAERRGQAGEASSEGRKTSSFISNLVTCLLCLSELC